MKIYGNLNGESVIVPVDSDRPLWAHYEAGSAGHDIFGRAYSLNLVRPVTRRRRVLAFLGIHELDTLRSPLFNGAKLVKRPKPQFIFDGTRRMFIKSRP